jgi:hypothetical protein
VEMLTRDPELQLTAGSYVDQLNRNVAPVDRSEQLFRKFVRFVNGVAAKQYPPQAKKNAVGRKATKKKTAAGG